MADERPAMRLTYEEVDLHVGAMIRQRRKLRRRSLHALAAVIGISYQQLQKYECGANRVSASMMFRIAGALGCDPAVFFDGLPAPGGIPQDEEGDDGLGPLGRAFLTAAGGLELARAYLALPAPHRRALLAAGRALCRDA